MQKAIVLIFFILFNITSVLAQKPAYVIYDSAGTQVSYQQMIDTLLTADVTFFGELHNNPICHWLELQVTKSFYEKKGQQLKLGAEMFESDAQMIMDEFLNNLIKASHFESEGKVWQNYSTDYAPLVEFAKENKLQFIATNIPRRYANMVARMGINSLDSLPKLARSYFAPLPVEVDMELPGYKQMLEMMGGGHSGAGGFSGENFVYAQAIKDATMAFFINENLSLGKGEKMLHFNGAYHSNNFEGILWYLNNFAPRASLMSISSVEVENVSSFDENHKGLANFIIYIPSDMTKTY